MKVWLDDERVAPPNWVWCITPGDVIRLLATGDVTDLSLDNDLGLEDPNEVGELVVRWLEEKVFNNRSFKVPNINIHTANPTARDKMKMGVHSITRWAQNEFKFTIMPSMEFHMMLSSQS